MKIHLFVTATGKYIQFVEDLLQSAEQYFCPEAKHNREYVLFTDAEPSQAQAIISLSKQYGRRIVFVPVKHEPYPMATMNRYGFYAKYAEQVADPKAATMQYAFCIDADAKFVGPCSLKELLRSKPLCFVTHCAFVKKSAEDLPFEKNPKSKCFVNANTNAYVYAGGGFWGGSDTVFFLISERIEAYLKEDQSNGIIPVWQDESALNAIVNRPHFFEYANILPVDYHVPEHYKEGILPHVKQWWDEIGLEVTPKILFLDKYRGNSNGANKLRY